jgi:hypothetical protein
MAGGSVLGVQSLPERLAGGEAIGSAANLPCPSGCVDRQLGSETFNRGDPGIRTRDPLNRKSALFLRNAAMGARMCPIKRFHGIASFPAIRWALGPSLRQWVLPQGSLKLRSRG